MAKNSAVNRNEMVKKLVAQYASRREALKATANNESLPLEERFEARRRSSQIVARLPGDGHADAGRLKARRGHFRHRSSLFCSARRHGDKIDSKAIFSPSTGESQIGEARIMLGDMIVFGLVGRGT